MRTALLIVLCLATPVWADAVDVSLTPRALIGKGLPQVQIHINEPIAGFELKLQRSDGKKLDIKGGGRPGVTREINLTQPEGSFKYTGELSINLPNGDTSSMPLEFEAGLFGPLRMTLDKKDVDVENRKVKFTLTRPIQKAHLLVMTDTGKKAFDGDVNFNGEPAGTPIELTWPETSGRVMKIAIQAYDTETFYTGIELYPWQVDIPHEEVNFDTNKWDIRPEEHGKLDKSLQLITDAVDKYGSLAELKLYVAGHTDTVGTNESNRTLSLNRAKSIGNYFRRRGLSIPIFYEGFGEEALLVPTPDNTDEPRNRRAEYIIAVEKPGVKNAPFEANWKRL